MADDKPDKPADAESDCDQALLKRLLSDPESPRIRLGIVDIGCVFRILRRRPPPDMKTYDIFLKILAYNDNISAMKEETKRSMKAAERMRQKIQEDDEALAKQTADMQRAEEEAAIEMGYCKATPVAKKPAENNDKPAEDEDVEGIDSLFYSISNALDPARLPFLLAGQKQSLIERNYAPNSQRPDRRQYWAFFVLREMYCHLCLWGLFEYNGLIDSDKDFFRQLIKKGHDALSWHIGEVKRAALKEGLDGQMKRAWLNIDLDDFDLVKGFPMERRKRLAEMIRAMTPLLEVLRASAEADKRDKGAESAGEEKLAAKKPAELRKYADEYREIHDSLKSTIARNDVEPRHVAKRSARSADKAGRILLTLMAEDHEGPWRSLSKPAPAIDAVMFWGTDGLRWLRKQKPLLFDMPQGEFDPSSIRADAKGVPLEGNVLADMRERIVDHLAGCRAMVDILLDEAERRADKGKDAGESGGNANAPVSSDKPVTAKAFKEAFVKNASPHLTKPEIAELQEKALRGAQQAFADARRLFEPTRFWEPPGGAGSAGEEKTGAKDGKKKKMKAEEADRKFRLLMKRRPKKVFKMNVREIAAEIGCNKDTLRKTPAYQHDFKEKKKNVKREVRAKRIGHDINEIADTA